VSMTDISPAVPASDSPASTDPVESGPALLRPLRSRDFRLLFAGETVSVLGDQFHFVALAWLALQLTGSGLALGTVLMTAAIPRAVFMLLGGAFSDRFSPRSLMLFSNAIRAVVVGILAALVLSGNAELWHLYVLAGIFGVVDAFFYPALSTIVPMLVPHRQLAPANALVQGAQQIMGLVGPALAGLMIALVNTGPAFAIDAASFGVAAVALLLIAGGRRHTGSAAAGGRPSVLSSIGGGVRAAWADPAVRSIVLLTASFNFAFTGPISVGLAFLADNRFDGGSAAFGLLFSAFGGGAVLGAIAAGSLPRVPRLGSILMVVAFALGIGLALIGLAPTLPVALAIIGVMGVLIGFINVQAIAWLQSRIPEALRGRVMSLVTLGSVGLAPVSLAIAGALVDLGAVTLVFVAGGAIVIVAAIAGVAWGVPSQMVWPEDEPEQLDV
jgi:MFS family permease